LSYQDPYSGDGGADVDFRVQIIIERASRNGSLTFKVVWKQLGAGHDKIEDTWQSLGNIPVMEPRILENFLAKHDITQEVAAKKAEFARDQRLATAQAEVKAARTNPCILDWREWAGPTVAIRLTRPVSLARLILVRWGRRARRDGIRRQ
jgi:hypothetical protein